MKIKKYFLLLFSLFILGSCGEFNKILKIKDYNVKYKYAKEFYDNKKYDKSITLFEDIVPYLKGSDKGEDALYLLGMSYYNSKDYVSANNIFSTYCNSYPNGKFYESSLFNSGYGLYISSPDVRLGQTDTYKAIAKLQSYLEAYPQSDKSADVKKYLFALQEKLAQKEYLAAKLYLNLGNYAGNNYEAAVVTAREAIKRYPFSKYLEDLQMIILRARYEYAENSVEREQPERFRMVVDEYFNYINIYPNGKYLKEAEKYYLKSKDKIKDLN